MIHRKTESEIAIMHEGGQKLGMMLQELLTMANAGVSLLSIDKQADEFIAKSGGTASFKTVRGYRWATCLCVNDVVVHGIPVDYVLMPGDVLTIDIGLIYGGFHTDTAWTKIVGRDPDEKAQQKKEQFLAAGQKALSQAIDLAKVGNHIGQISASTQKIIEGAGYSIVKSLVGHGVGKELHEEPQVPNYLRGQIEATYRLVGGETIAIEPIYAQGEGATKYKNSDGWTIATRDGSLSAVFEHSVAITPKGPIVLTKVDF